MATLKAFTMPKWGIEMAEGTIAEWGVAEGQRFTFNFDTTLLPKATEVELGSWVKLPGNTRRPRRLRAGKTVVEFDERGAPLSG